MGMITEKNGITNQNVMVGNNFKKMIFEDSMGMSEEKNKQPFVKKIVIRKRKPKMFMGCWQEANGQDFC